MSLKYEPASEPLNIYMACPTEGPCVDDRDMTERTETLNEEAEEVESKVEGFLCTKDTIQVSYTLHTTHSPLHTTHYTLHTTHYTLHTTHYTLHTTHYTLHAE